MSNRKYYTNKSTIEFIIKQFYELTNHKGFKYNNKKYPDLNLDGYLIENIHAILFSELSLNPSIGKFEAQAIIRESIFKSIQEFGATVNLDEYIHVIRKLESESLQKENIKYTFYNSLSAVPKSYQSVKFKNSLGSFRILKNWPKRIRKSKDWKYAVHSAGHAPPKNFHIVKIVIKDKNLHDAADKAWKCVDLERAFWNYNLNILRERVLLTLSKPFNKIFWGPIHFAEYEDNLTYFYEPFYKANFKELVKNLSKFRENSYEITKQNYSNHFDKNFIGEALIKYTNALDLPEKNLSLTKLWELLEYLMCQENNENYGKMIEKASKLFENEIIVKMSLEHIRTARNEYIHSSNDVYPNSPKTLFMIKSIIEMILLFHFNNGDKFIDINEYKTYLGLPAKKKLDKGKEMLDKKIELIVKKKNIPQLSTMLIWRT